MKRIFYIIMLITAFILTGCGSATEVGNPTGEVPTTRIIKGTIDLMTLDDIPIEELLVKAVSSDLNVFESDVDESGGFSLELNVGDTYSLALFWGEEKIGDFSFQEDDVGNRSNRLTIEASGSDFDLGMIQFQGGMLIPENEPFGHQGFQYGSQF